MRKATGAVAVSWARAGGAIFISDVEVCRTTQSMPFMICRMAAIFSWTTSWSALFAAMSKIQARSFGPVMAPSHVAMTIGSMSSSSCMLCLRCVWGNPLAGLAVWGGKVLWRGVWAWMVVLRRCSVAIARWAWRLGVIRAMVWWVWVAGLVAGGCWGCGWVAWVAKPRVLLEGDGVFPLPSAVWYGEASLNMVWGRCVVGGVSVIS